MQNTCIHKVCKLHRKLKIGFHFSRDTQSTPPQLQPHQLQYQSLLETPKSSRQSVPATPTTLVTPQSVVSPASSSSLTPMMQGMSLSRGRGRPCKDLVEPSMEGFPEHDMGEEKQKWLKMKATEI